MVPSGVSGRSPCPLSSTTFGSGGPRPGTPYAGGGGVSASFRSRTTNTHPTPASGGPSCARGGRSRWQRAPTAAGSIGSLATCGLCAAAFFEGLSPQGSGVGALAKRGQRSTALLLGIWSRPPCGRGVKGWPPAWFRPVPLALSCLLVELVGFLIDLDA